MGAGTVPGQAIGSQPLQTAAVLWPAIKAQHGSAAANSLPGNFAALNASVCWLPGSLPLAPGPGRVQPILGSGYAVVAETTSGERKQGPSGGPAADDTHEYPSEGTRQDVPPTKPGDPGPSSPDLSNPQVDRSDYAAPGTNPDTKPSAERQGEFAPPEGAQEEAEEQADKDLGKPPMPKGGVQTAANAHPDHPEQRPQEGVRYHEATSVEAHADSTHFDDDVSVSEVMSQSRSQRATWANTAPIETLLETPLGAAAEGSDAGKGTGSSDGAASGQKSNEDSDGFEPEAMHRGGQQPKEPQPKDVDDHDNEELAAKNPKKSDKGAAGDIAPEQVAD